MAYRHNPEAEKILLSFMDDEQKRCYKAYGHFFVHAKNGGVYGLSDGWRVCCMYDGLAETEYHVGATGSECAVAKEDSLLTQLLFLQTDPATLLREACSNPPYRYLRAGCPPMDGYRVAEPAPPVKKTATRRKKAA